MYLYSIMTKLFATVFFSVLFQGCYVQGLYFTPWLDRDNASGYGDYETYVDFEPNPCGSGSAVGAECRRRSDHVASSSTGQVFVSGYDCTAAGLACRNSDNISTCADYEIRFQCCTGIYFTPWLDRDNASGSGDYETYVNFAPIPCGSGSAVGAECRRVSDQVASSSTGQVFQSGYDCTAAGLACRNSDNISMCADYEIRFQCCPGCNAQGNYFTPWLDRDNAGGVGDYETYVNFVPIPCGHGSAVGAECRRRSDQVASSNTGQVFVSGHDCTAAGLACKNNDNISSCADYEVRFCCPGYVCIVGDGAMCSACRSGHLRTRDNQCQSCNPGYKLNSEHECERDCCQDFSSTCLACGLGLTEEEYCKSAGSYNIPGCSAWCPHVRGCPSCTDSNRNCSMWTFYCSWHSWVQTNCERTCGTC